MNVPRAVLIGGVAALLALAATACNACTEGELEPTDDEDTGFADTRGGTVGGDTDVTTDGGGTGTGGDADTGGMQDGGGDGGMDPGQSIGAFTSCGAGGVSSGNGVRAYQCYGPVEISGSEASGGGVRWRAGAFRVITEGVK